MKFIKKTDIIIIGVILIISAGAFVSYHFVFGNKAAKAEIYYQSQLVETVDLTSGVDKRFSIMQNKNVVFHVYQDGSICFEESDCRDKICVHAGKLHTIGDSAACLPNNIVMKIVAKGKRGVNDPDMMIG